MRGVTVEGAEGILLESCEREWKGWQKARKIGRKRVSRSLSAALVANLTDAWWFAQQAFEAPLNRFVTIRPGNIDSLNPEQRGRLWHGVLNKFAQFARDNGFQFVHVWSRESDRPTGQREHLHVLTHVPPPLFSRFDKVVSGWFPGTGEIDIRQAHYRDHIRPTGKRGNAIRYVTKNSPQAAYQRDREYRKGGPILGKRAGCSRNIDGKARSRWDARRAIRNEFGHGGLKTEMAPSKETVRSWQS